MNKKKRLLCSLYVWKITNKSVAQSIKYIMLSGKICNNIDHVKKINLLLSCNNWGSIKENYM